MNKLAIHHRKGSFSDRWISYCEKNNLDFIIVDCFSTSIVSTLKNNNITHLFWHMTHSSYKDLQVFPYVLNSIEEMGIKTFPDFNTRWHFDDKIAQKYLLESINAPLVGSDVFYSQKEALLFIDKIPFPLVSKLKRGAGSANVSLLQHKNEAKLYIEKMFSTGVISTSDVTSDFKQKFRIAKKIKNPFTLFKKIISFLKKNKEEKSLANAEKGYVYFQEFLPGNSYDTRIIVIGNIAFGIRRFNRKDDFRASGSGKLDYDPKNIDLNLIELAFALNKRLKMQCVAFDFIYDKKNEPKVVEFCFGFSMLAYDSCPGYWNVNLNFTECKFNPQEMMLNNLININ